MRVATDMLVEETEIRLLLDGLHHCFGFDFRDYAAAPIRQRIWECVEAEGLQTISGLQERVLHDHACLERLLRALAPKSPAMFDDPAFFVAFRTTVVPLLRTYPFLDIWVPACSTGEDVFALAIVLQEEGLSQRVRIYATDLSESIFRTVADGRFPLGSIAAYAANYRRAGGAALLSDYYTIEGDRAVMLPSLREQVTVSEHSLSTDGCFHEFHMIVCRNILPLFNDWLRERVHYLFRYSLCRFGVLGLGDKEYPLERDDDKFYEGIGNGWYRKTATLTEV
ncbi:MAG: CheR family methyltransferase [Nitrospiraceae bacterium]